MPRFDGRGRGAASGVPLEAVVQDLCDTRKDLQRTATSVDKMREAASASKFVLDAMLIAMNEIRGLMRDLKEITAAGIQESHEFWAKLDDMQIDLEKSRVALKENTEKVSAE
jgi:hypothetical protein